MKYAFILITLFSCSFCIGQKTPPHPPPQPPTLPRPAPRILILTTDEIQIMNFSGSTVSFRRSADKTNWTVDSVSESSQISRQALILYVELCQDITNTTVCDTFQLEHSCRYVIDLDDSKTRLVIKHTNAQ